MKRSGALRGRVSQIIIGVASRGGWGVGVTEPVPTLRPSNTSLCMYKIAPSVYYVYTYLSLASTTAFCAGQSFAHRHRRARANTPTLSHTHSHADISCWEIIIASEYSVYFSFLYTQSTHGKKNSRGWKALRCLFSSQKRIKYLIVGI